MNNVSIWSVPSYEDPFLDLPLPWRERIEVRGSFVYLVYLVCLVMPRSGRDSGFGIQASGFGHRASGLGYLDRKK